MEEPWWKVTLKYFLHGFFFSVVFLALAILWLFFLSWIVFSIPFYAFPIPLGAIINFMGVFFIIGGLNSFLTGVIWSIQVNGLEERFWSRFYSVHLEYSKHIICLHRAELSRDNRASSRFIPHLRFHRRFCREKSGLLVEKKYREQQPIARA